jgi:Holliday junction resolvase
MELEQQIQKRIIKRLEENGYFTLKLIKCNKNGYPDLIAIKNGVTTFIEVKRPNGKLSELQKVRIKQLREQNIKVLIWQDYEQNFSSGI